MIWLVALTTLFSEPPAATGNTFASATLGQHVLNVVLRSAQEQVGGSDAGGIVAAVEHEHILGNLADENTIGDSWCQQHASYSAAGTDDTVAILVPTAIPEDAAVGLFAADIPKKTVHQRRYLVRVVANLRAILAFADFDLTDEHGEGLATVNADATDLHRMTGHAGPPSKVQGVRSDVFKRVAPLF